MSFSIHDIVMANAEWRPQRIIMYSVHGLGKSTFAAGFNSPIFVRTEDGAGALGVATFPQVVQTFEDLEQTIITLHTEDHNFKTLVIDTLDWLEPAIHQKQMQMMPVSEKGKKITNIEDYGYGRGYSLCMDWWRYIMGGIDSLRASRGMNIVILAHSETKRYDAPDSEPYDRYQIKIHKTAAALWQEWADIVLFANYRTKIRSSDVGFNKEVKRGDGSGERILYTEERPAYHAKNKWGLPPEIYIGQDKTWGPFHAALSKATGGRYEYKTQNSEGTEK